jgi:hypothetical protein
VCIRTPSSVAPNRGSKNARTDAGSGRPLARPDRRGSAVSPAVRDANGSSDRRSARSHAGQSSGSPRSRWCRQRGHIRPTRRREPVTRVPFAGGVPASGIRTTARATRSASRSDASFCLPHSSASSGMCPGPPFPPSAAVGETCDHGAETVVGHRSAGCRTTTVTRREPCSRRENRAARAETAERSETVAFRSPGRPRP